MHGWRMEWMHEVGQVRQCRRECSVRPCAARLHAPRLLRHSLRDTTPTTTVFSVVPDEPPRYVRCVWVTTQKASRSKIRASSARGVVTATERNWEKSALVQGSVGLRRLERSLACATEETRREYRRGRG